MQSAKILLSPSHYNIYLKSNDKLIVWNTVNDKLVIVSHDSDLYQLYVSHAVSNIPKSSLFEAKLGSEEAVHMLCGFLDINDKEVSFAKEPSKTKKKYQENQLEIVITTTLGCNFACAYCCQGLDKNFESFDYSLVDDIIRIVASSEVRKLHITWYGGEPLLHHKMIEDASIRIRDYCKGHDVLYSSDLLTNGYLLTNTTAAKLQKAGIDYVQISLDGSKQSHNNSRYLKNGSPTFDTIMRNIQLIENDISLNIKMSVRINISSSDLNADTIIADLLHYEADRWNKTRFYLAPIEVRVGTDQSFNPKGISTSEFARLYQDFIRLAKGQSVPYFIPGFYRGLCTATKNYSMVIDPNGNIFKCWDEIVQREKAIATTKCNSDKILSKITTSSWNDFDASQTTYCMSCKLLPVCGGHCGKKHEDIAAYSGYHSACPPIKLMLKEYILDRSLANGLISKDEECDFLFSDISLEFLQRT